MARLFFFFCSLVVDSQFQFQGEVCPDPASKRNTLLSRLYKLWAHVKASRHRFECEPETGFLGKSLTRHFNRFWNYVLKGFFGSLLMAMFFLPLCLLCSFTCIVLALLAPIWVPSGVLAMHLFAVLIYDFDHPDYSNKWFYLTETFAIRLILHSVLQPFCALFLAFIVLPMTSLAILVGGILRRILRTIWDVLMFHCIIKKRGRIPSQDTFIARRIAGPGLASNYYYQIRPEQALAAVEAQMEAHELDVWWENYSNIIEQPKREFKKFVESCFGPFSAAIVEEGVYQKLLIETKEHQNALWKHVQNRKQKLYTGLNADTQSRIKLTSRELKVVIAQTSKMLEEFYPIRVLNRLTKPERKFWEEKRLDYRDWQGLAVQMLTQVFSPSIAVPLEEIDTCFKLNVEHLNLKRYLEMLKTAEFRDDLDVVSAVHSPKGDVDVDPPSMNIKVFNPNHDFLNHVHSKEQSVKRRKKEKKTSFPELLALFERLLLPLPVAHPTMVAIIIHNRDEKRLPIRHDDNICQLILAKAEGLPYAPAGPDNQSGTAPVSVAQSNLDDNLEVNRVGTEASREGSLSFNIPGDTYHSSVTTPHTMGSSSILAPEASTSSVRIEIPGASFSEEFLMPMPRHSKTTSPECGDASSEAAQSLIQAHLHSGTL